jgi:glycerol-3-phosphate dehydrogenase
MTTLLNLASKCIPIAALAGLILANRVESEPKVWNPSRKQLLKEMRETKQFDVLIIGGGATGAGCALDAATRGLKTALVEQDDFSSGTSSRSTKLVHGGVRYLEKAFLELDHEQYKLVCEALNERAVFLKIAPYLSYELPIMIPLQKYMFLS